MMKNKDTVFVYDKNNNLITFVEFDGDRIHSLYRLEGRNMTKKYTNIYDGELEEKHELIEYDSDIVLQHLYLMGESHVRATVPGQNYVGRAKSSNFVQAGDGIVEYFSMKPDLIQSWVSILNMSGPSV